MSKFYELKLFTGFGYFSLFMFSCFGFSGGKTLPIGLVVLIIIPFIAELIISIYYVNVSRENKKIHFLCFSVIFFILAVFIGIGFGIYETEKTRKYLINIGIRIEEYKFDNNTEELTENDITNIGLPNNIYIENYGNEYVLRFKDAVYRGETKMVYFKPRP